MAIETMNVSLPDTLKRYVEERVSEGGYGNTSEYIRELIRQDREERKRQAQAKLEGLLLEGLESLERGEGIEVTPEYWQEFRREARERLARLQAEKKG
jgi:antitoxin ParD1/3/4